MSASQAAAIQETVSSLNEITSMVKQTVEFAQQSLDTTEDSFKTSKDAQDKVEKMKSSMGTIQELVEKFGRKSKKPMRRCRI